MSCSVEVHAVDSTEIPFITEVDEPPPEIPDQHSPFCSHYSRKMSFPDENREPRAFTGRRISSLEELRLYRGHILPEIFIRDKLPPREKIRRHSSQLRSHDMRRKSSIYDNCRRSSTASRISRKGSRYSHSASQSRRNSSTKSTRSLPLEMTPKEADKEKRRRRAVFVVVAIFLFILLCCILAVVVTLTHQSEIVAENKTMTYYTFAPDPRVFIYNDFSTADDNGR